jgi:hypothetical protein
MRTASHSVVGLVWRSRAHFLLGGAAAPRLNATRKGAEVPETWDELARKEYAATDEPISARASDLTKLGAPVAAFVTAVLAAVGGWAADAPAGDTVIGVAIVTAVTVGGLLYVFAADFRSRAAVSVARFNNLYRHAKGEAKANEKVQAEARAAVERAEAVSATKSEDAEKATKHAAEVTAELVDTRERLRRCTEQSKTANVKG